MEDFIINDLLPEISQGPGRFVRQPSDQLRLATAVNKSEPIYLSQSADCRQATDDLLKTWFRTSSQGQEYNIFVIIEREEKDELSYDQSLKIKEEKKEEKKPIIKTKKNKGKEKSTVKEEKTEILVQDVLTTETSDSQSASRKRSFSDLSAISESLPSPDSLLEPVVSYRTRRKHELNEEDLERIAQYN